MAILARGPSARVIDQESAARPAPEAAAALAALAAEYEHASLAEKEAVASYRTARDGLRAALLAAGISEPEAAGLMNNLEAIESGAAGQRHKDYSVYRAVRLAKFAGSMTGRR